MIDGDRPHDASKIEQYDERSEIVELAPIGKEPLAGDGLLQGDRRQVLLLVGVDERIAVGLMLDARRWAAKMQHVALVRAPLDQRRRVGAQGSILVVAANRASTDQQR